MRRVDPRELLAVLVGGMAGAVLRVWITEHFRSGGAHWPWAIFLINISGAGTLAFAVTRLQERLPLSTYRRPLLGTGFCGAYTTFSTMELELLGLLDHQRYGLAIAYAAANLSVGYLAIWITTALVRRSRTLW